MAKRYLAVAEELRHRIEAGRYQRGGKLESERVLLEQFEVSRSTIRKALDLLESDGLIRRRQGRGGGTFVQTKPPQVDLNEISGFMPQLRARGLSVDSELLSASLDYATATHAEHLQIPLRSPMFRVERLRRVEGVPLLIEDSVFPATAFPELLEEDLTQSLYELLDRRFHRAPRSKQEVIVPAMPNARQREHLQLLKKELVLKIMRTAFDGDGVPIEYSVDVLRSDVARIRVATNHPPER
ncbi:GntR family transcriptional regulator [Corynebacterium pelargi]|uniref:HTH-type transcriptional repressor YvoA n=1 Tax=Corynebacterium pelargi TaxID=1471400 RepID=A0A410W874_9CORY|nr:GntR family transcriptional regulator [Corynebacterium pelargi]QAU52157.1 HTH-type transcriptional repressor YvoA [Corynebacterium pelargi]GGG69735.1 putative transcriptional regulator, GntR family protein [Corynebacterium pelargi]